MNNAVSIYSNVYNLLKGEKTKISRKDFDMLDREDIADIIVDENRRVFWFESWSNGRSNESRGNGCTQNVYNYLKKFIKRKHELEYLFDVNSI